MRALVLVAVLSVTACATVTARDEVAVPVVVNDDAAGEAWVEVDGERQPAPAIVRLKDPQRSRTVIVGAPGQAPMTLRLDTEFRWRTLLLPHFAVVDLVTGHAWELPGRQVEVDLGTRSWTSEPNRAPYLQRDDYRSASRYRRVGIGLTIGGTVASIVGYGLAMSAVCYEECSDDMGMRLGGGLGLSTVGTAAAITGAVMWIRASLRRGRIAREFSANPTW